jgi:outer membrane usher protein
LWTRRARKVTAFLIAWFCCAISLQAQEVIRPTITIRAPAAATPAIITADLALQLDVFVNGRSLNLISAFTLRGDRTLISSPTELAEIGLLIPVSMSKAAEVALDRLPGLAFVYDELAQTIHFTGDEKALTPMLIHAQPIVAAPDPVRPPFGALVNYTLFSSADNTKTNLSFGGLSGEFESRTFGTFGLLENDGIARIGGAENGFTRLDSRYSYEDPSNLITYTAGDYISGGFEWTRPVRMAGFSIRRSFDLRPDLVTIPLPTLSGSAAVPSTLDLFVNQVRMLSTDVPQGPFKVYYPPVINGSGMAQIVLHDVVGRQIAFNSSFYASPELLAPGLTDFSAEIGFARLDYALTSFGYDPRPMVSGSWRLGVADWLTVQAHGEAIDRLASVGGGAVATLGTFALASVAISGSHATGDSGGNGGLVDLVLESRLPHFDLLLRTQRTMGSYEDIASWTAVLPPILHSSRHIFGQPQELDQASVSTPLPWPGGSIGTSYIRTRSDTDRSRVATISLTQDFGRISVFASAYRDFELQNSLGLFMGLSMSLGADMDASVGVSRSGGRNSGYIEASQQGSHDAGDFGWTARLSSGDQTEADGTVRYGTSFGRFEANAASAGPNQSANILMQGAISVVGGQVHTTRDIDDSFAIVDVGAPGVTILHENRVAGVTDASGKLLVTNLVPFVANRIALDPTGLPVDAEIGTTSAVVAPYRNVGASVTFGVKIGAAALLALSDLSGKVIALGSEVVIQGNDESSIVGYDGEVYVQDLKEHNIALVTTPDGEKCRVAFDYHRIEGEQVTIGGLICKPASKGVL